MLDRLRLFLIGALAITLGGCNHISSEQQASLLAEVDAALAASAESDARRSTGVQTALSAKSLATTRCPAGVALVDKSETEKLKALPASTGTHNYSAGTPEELAASPGFRHCSAKGNLEFHRQLISRQGTMHTLGSLFGPATVISDENIDWARDRTAALIDPSQSHRYEVVLGWLEVEEKLEIDGEMFPSRIRARAVVWDHVEGAVACAAEVDEVTPDSIRVTYYEDKGMSNDDVKSAAACQLYSQTRDSALAALGL